MEAIGILFRWRFQGDVGQSRSLLASIAGDENCKTLAIGREGASYFVELSTAQGWVAGPPLPADDVRDVAGAAGEFWAVGGGGLVAHFDGQVWVAEHPVEQDLLGIWAEPHSLWIVSEGSVLHGESISSLQEITTPRAVFRGD